MTDEKTTNELLRDSKSLLVRTALRLAEVEKERDALMVATSEEGPKIARTILEGQAKKIARLEAAEFSAVTALAAVSEAATAVTGGKLPRRKCLLCEQVAIDPEPLVHGSVYMPDERPCPLASDPAAMVKARDERRDKEVRADAIMWAADKYDLPAGNGGGSWAAVRARFRALSEEVRRG